MRSTLGRTWLLLTLLAGCGDEDRPALPDDAGSADVRSAGSGGDGGAGTGGRMPAAGSGKSGSGGGSAASGADAASGGAGAHAGAGGAGASGGAGGADAGADDGPPAVRYVGRVDLADPAGGRFAWSGSGVVARFESDSLSVTLTGGQQYTVLIDGMVRLPKLVISSGSTPIADDLSDGVHTVEMYRRTEANQGISQFQGFSFGSNGRLLAPAPAPSRRLEVIGDSISVGYGNEGPDQNCTFTPDTENHYLSYGAIAARSVDAELHTIAWSGRGVVCNYGDDADSCNDPFPTIYDRTLPTENDSAWDFSRYQPQAVVINLGTNDYSTDQDPSEAQFTDAYRAFLEHVRSRYPDALILCTCGPLLYGAELDMVRAYIANAVAATHDDNIKTFDIPSQSASDGLGCDYHPSIATHQKMAALLVDVLKRELGW